jgi:CHASE3 domain sensor protein
MRKQLAGFADAQSLVNENFDRLHELFGEEPAASTQAGQLRALLDDSFAKQEAEIEARRTGKPGDAAKIFASGDSDLVNREIRTILAGFENSEQMRLLERSDTTQFVGAATTLIIIIGSSVAVIALLSAGWLILRDFARRRAAEAALAQQAQLLSDVIDTMPNWYS